MKKWSKPEISNLCVQLTNEFEIEPLNEFEVVPLKNENSCDQSPQQASKNVNKGCSATTCEYYKDNNEGVGKGGKCRGTNGIS